jgi:hypothetical protein
VRTYSRDVWLKAQDAWATGEFSDEWKSIRHHAAMRGIIFPPEGTRWDSWGDDSPSQRAIVIRAIRETPDLLLVAVSRSSNWGGVVRILLGTLNEEVRPDLLDWERRERQRRLEEEGGPREATMALGNIIKRLGDSL